MLKFLLPIALFAVALPAWSQPAKPDGAALYTTYCSACHGVDGKGNAGAFPPLAGSPWVLGEVHRSVKIVLHGIEGPIEVLGKSYNLVMPPQGGMLNDDQIAAILTYVRAAWGNNAPQAHSSHVAVQRALAGERAEPWKAEELLKMHPLEFNPSALKHVISRTYHGEWQQLPDFSKLEPENFEEEQSGILTLTHVTRKEHFAMLWEAEFVAETDGQHTFRLLADDAARVTVAGQVVAEIRSPGGMKDNDAREGVVVLKKGGHRVRVEYLQTTGKSGLTLGWKSPEVTSWRWLTSDAPAAPVWPPMVLRPKSERAVIYRNFIEGTTPRGIGVGFPGGANLAYSADHGAPELVWRGAFIDAGRHWTGRGQGAQPPASEEKLKLTDGPAFAVLDPPAAAWPERPELATTFKGYELDARGNPTFTVQAAEWTCADRLTPEGEAILRTLTLSGKPPAGTALLLASKLPVQALGADAFEIDGKLVVAVKAAQPARLLNGTTLVLPLDDISTAEVRYSWK